MFNSLMRSLSNSFPADTKVGMFPKILFVVTLVSGSSLGVSLQAKPLSEAAVSKMIQTADAYRLEHDAAKVVSLVTLYEHDKRDKSHLYHVYTRPQRESLVVFKSASEVGQKMLMLGDNYWLLMPKSRRPIRITPMQKLLGEASVGDISTLTWHDDYQGKWRAETTISRPDGEALVCEQLQLEAVTAGASYHKITLWLAKESHFPIKADYYLRSGKLAKQAWFSRGERDGKPAVVAMTLLDKIQTSKKTVIEYQRVEPASLADKYYNPAYLSRNKIADL